jgi:predicted O-methyltransferase YrrM
MIYLKLLAGIALVVSIFWVHAKPGYDSWLSVVVSLSALGALFVTDNKMQSGTRQQRVVSKSSIGVQAGGDVNIGTNSRERNAK